MRDKVVRITFRGRLLVSFFRLSCLCEGSSLILMLFFMAILSSLRLHSTKGSGGVFSGSPGRGIDDDLSMCSVSGCQWLLIYALLKGHSDVNRLLYTGRLRQGIHQLFLRNQDADDYRVTPWDTKDGLQMFLALKTFFLESERSYWGFCLGLLENVMELAFDV